MKFPSVKYLTSQAGASFKRFYLPLIYAFTGSYAALLLINNYHSIFLTRTLFTCILGLSLSLGCMLYTERTAKHLLKWLMPALAVALSAAYWYWLAPGSF